MKIDISRLRKEIDLFSFDDPSLFLKELYALAKDTSKTFTIKDFSEALGFGSNNTMAQVHSGHRKITDKSVGKITESLGMNRSESKYFDSIAKLKYSQDQSEKEKLLSLVLELRSRHNFPKEKHKELDFFNSWHHAVVFEILDQNEAKTLDEIRSKFAIPISAQELQKSLDFLSGLGFVSLESNEPPKYRKTKEDFSTTNAVPGLAIVRFHQEMMNLAKESLVETPPNQRDISAVTISVDQKTVERIKDDIALFRKYLMFLASTCEDKEQVMQLNIQLFPLSK